MTIYCGNLSRDVTEDDLRQVFEAYGKVGSVSLAREKFSGDSRGFGFVEMSEEAEARVGHRCAERHPAQGPLPEHRGIQAADREASFLRRRKALRRRRPALVGKIISICSPAPCGGAFSSPIDLIPYPYGIGEKP